MARIRLIHWNAAESRCRAAKIEGAGYEVDGGPLAGPDDLRKLQKDPPDAVVIDLSRLPSQGRDLAVLLRKSKPTRHLPLVFVDGDPEKVVRVRQLLPDAVYCTWSRVRSSLKRALTRPPAEPVVPQSSMAGYGGSPLPKKLGIQPNSVVALIGAPQGFEETLGRLPENVALRRQARGRRDLTIWLPKSRRDLQSRIPRMVPFAEGGRLWIVWPKKASGVVTDLSQVEVRRIGLAAGLVDYKVCSIDATWTGLRFSRRKAP